MDKLTQDREYLVLDNLSIVHYIIQKRMHIFPDHVNYEDFYQEGCIGLILSAVRFDESKGFKFATYAFPMVYGSIQRYKRETLPGIKYPRKLKDVMFKVMSLKSKGLSLKDIESIEGISGQDIRDVLCVTHIDSLNRDIQFDDDSIPMGELIEDTQSSDTLEDILSTEHILECIQLTSDDLKSDWKKGVWEEYIYSTMCGEQLRQTYFSKKYGVSQSVVSRALIESKSIFSDYIAQ